MQNCFHLREGHLPYEHLASTSTLRGKGGGGEHPSRPLSPKGRRRKLKKIANGRVHAPFLS